MRINNMQLIHWILLFLTIISEVQPLCRKCFPPDFKWGVATSAYQIEGAWNVSGKGVSLWDWWTHTYPDAIEDLSNGDVACNSYQLYNEDITNLKQLGVTSYRFSLSWSRILPNGTVDNINQEGVDYYLRLLESLASEGIEPLVTLYHWDLPLVFHERGGWTNTETADYFAEYATLCFELFGHLVKRWITLNEPITQCYYGYGIGIHAPGYAESGTLFYTCAYAQILAHAKAYRSYENDYKAAQNGEVGFMLVNIYYVPRTESDEDQEAAERAQQWGLGLFGHPVFVGDWPEVVKKRIDELSALQGFNASRLPAFSSEEIDLINGTADFIAVNYYTTFLASPMENIEELESTTINYLIDRNAASSYGDWLASENKFIYNYPEGFRGMLNWIVKNFGNRKIIITENGWSDYGTYGLNDTNRITYLTSHLCSLLSAILVDGVNVVEYHHWSFMDNFEWSSGYVEKFGLIEVNFSSPTLTRTPKESFYVYESIIKSNCLRTCSFL